MWALRRSVDPSRVLQTSTPSMGDVQYSVMTTASRRPWRAGAGAAHFRARALGRAFFVRTYLGTLSSSSDLLLLRPRKILGLGCGARASRAVDHRVKAATRRSRRRPTRHRRVRGRAPSGADRSGTTPSTSKAHALLEKLVAGGGYDESRSVSETDASGRPIRRRAQARAPSTTPIVVGPETDAN